MLLGIIELLDAVSAHDVGTSRACKKKVILLDIGIGATVATVQRCAVRAFGPFAFRIGLTVVALEVDTVFKVTLVQTLPSRFAFGLMNAMCRAVARLTATPEILHFVTIEFSRFADLGVAETTTAHQVPS